MQSAKSRAQKRNAKKRLEQTEWDRSGKVKKRLKVTGGTTQAQGCRISSAAVLLVERAAVGDEATEREREEATEREGGGREGGRKKGYFPATVELLDFSVLSSLSVFLSLSLSFSCAVIASNTVHMHH